MDGDMLTLALNLMVRVTVCGLIDTDRMDSFRL